jgi:hypothetical protein
MCGPGRPGGETLDSLSGSLCSAICLIAESYKATFMFGDVTANKVFMHPFFSGCANWPRLEKGKDKKRAAGVPRLQ